MYLNLDFVNTIIGSITDGYVYTTMPSSVVISLKYYTSENGSEYIGLYDKTNGFVVGDRNAASKYLLVYPAPDGNQSFTIPKSSYETFFTNYNNLCWALIQSIGLDYTLTSDPVCFNTSAL
jgi:hypothetical protein